MTFLKIPKIYFRILILLSLSLPLNAQVLQVSDRVTPVSLKSQHNKHYTLVENGIWIVTWDKTSTRVANKYFEQYGMKKDINLIVDTSQAPSSIFSFFILPKMKSYAHQILLSFDAKYNQTLPYKDDCITLLYIKNAKVAEIVYIKNTQELKKLLE